MERKSFSPPSTSMPEESKPVPSPCIRHCCLNEDDICVGCYRSLEEITGWSNATNQQRLEILERTYQRKASSTKPPL